MAGYTVYFPSPANTSYGIFCSCFDKTEYKFKTVKEYFQYKKNNFKSKVLTLEEINKLFAKGFVIFPVNETKFTDVEIYKTYSFKPCFMRVKDFVQLKKELRTI